MSVVREGKFSKAAEALSLTQSAVSQHIHALEGGLGVKLFERRHRGVQLTEAGEKLRAYAEKILWLAAAAEHEIMDISQLKSGRLEIGATPVVAVYLFPEWVKEFSARYPQITLSVHTGITTQIVEQVRAHKWPLGIVEGELNDAEGLETLVLRDIVLYVVVSSRHPWAKRKRVPVHMLSGQPFVTRSMDSQTHEWLMRTLGEVGIQLRVVAEFDDPDSIKRAVQNDVGISILPACMLRDVRRLGGLHYLELEDLPLARKLKAVWSADQPLHPLAGAFVEVVQAMIAGNRTFTAFAEEEEEGCPQPPSETS